MNLEEFVTESLVQLVEGVSTAQLRIHKGATINPKQRSTKPRSVEYGTGIPVQEIEFDIAVTVDEGKQTKGGIGVVAGVFALGSQGQSSAATQSVSRIKFSVPISFPHVNKPEYMSERDKFREAKRRAGSPGGRP